MVLRELVSSDSDVKVYQIAASKLVPEWERAATDRARRALKKKDEELQRHLELLQGLEFDAACTKMKLTRDGCFLLAAGYHPPTVKCFDLNELSMKWQRCLTSEIVAFEPLQDDYSKIAFICSDRTVAFHAKFGAYFSTRTPRVCRSMVYEPETAELLIGGSSSDLYRLSLSEGRFMAPLSVDMESINCLDIAPAHGLLAVGGEQESQRGGGTGKLQCFDPRSRKKAGSLDVDDGVSIVKFNPNGMQVACGTMGGLVNVYDLRSSEPLIIKDHMYDTKIVSLQFHSTTAGNLVEDTKRAIISSDRHAVRIWDIDSARTISVIEPRKSTINDVCNWPGSGLMLVGCDHSKIQSYFIPSMGPAPKWCHFLEGLTEELEENKSTTVYDDYKFVTKKDLNALGLDHLIGTNLLRPSLHGFFLDLRLYKKAKSIADPFAYEKYRKQKIEEVLKSQEESRITIRKKPTKVNVELASKLQDQASKFVANENVTEDNKNDTNNKDLTSTERKRMKKERSLATQANTILQDERFKAMFEDEDFQIDEKSVEYKILHPNAGKGEGNLLEEYFDEDDMDEDDEDDGDEEQQRHDGGLSEDEDIESEDMLDDQNDLYQSQGWGMNADIAFNTVPKYKNGFKRNRSRLLTEKDENHAEAFAKGVSISSEVERPLEERIQTTSRSEKKSMLAKSSKNNREISFEIEAKKRKRKGKLAK